MEATHGRWVNKVSCSHPAPVQWRWRWPTGPVIHCVHLDLDQSNITYPVCHLLVLKLSFGFNIYIHCPIETVHWQQLQLRATKLSFFTILTDSLLNTRFAETRLVKCGDNSDWSRNPRAVKPVDVFVQTKPFVSTLNAVTYFQCTVWEIEMINKQDCKIIFCPFHPTSCIVTSPAGKRLAAEASNGHFELSRIIIYVKVIMSHEWR